MISLYSNAYKLFKKPEYKDLVYQTIDFLDNEMDSPNGLYYAAMDADTDGEEGKYYSFNLNEIESISGEQINLFNSFFNIDIDSPWDNNKFLLLPTRDLESWLAINSLDKDKFLKMKESWFEEIMKIKSKRTKPRIDDKSETTLGDLPTRIFVGMLDVGTVEEDASDEGWNAPSKLNADPAKIHAQSMMRYNQLFTQVLEITIPLNTTLTAGYIIRLSLIHI